MALQIQHIHQLSLGCLSDLVQESQDSGFRAIQRLIDDWNSGTNQFSQPGEALFVAQWHDRTVGICGLNIDTLCCNSHHRTSASLICHAILSSSGDWTRPGETGDR
jgi:hypothetical protein